MSECKHKGYWAHVDTFCVACVEEVEEKLEKAVSTLQRIANNNSLSPTPQEDAERTLDELGFTDA